MPTATSDITIPSADGGAIPAYLSLPAKTPAPVVILVAAVFGVDDVTRKWADRFAERGFVAVAPDFFWRTIPGPKRMDVPEERAEAMERNQKFDRDKGVSDIAAVRDYFAKRPESNGKWSVAGYCFGGRYTLIAGAEMGADAVVAFHPSKMDEELADAGKLKCPVSFHIGDNDAAVPMDVVEKIRAALTPDALAHTYIYPGVGHGFTMGGNPNFNAEVSETSFERALTVLDPLKTLN